METTSKTAYTETTETITINGTSRTYYVYTYNGATRGSVTLPIPTRAGYTFNGWYTDNEDYTTEITQNTIVTGNINGYAKWVPKQVPLDYVFYIPGECSFTSTGIVNGENGDCISTINPTGSNIDYTGSSLSSKKYKEYYIPQSKMPKVFFLLFRYFLNKYFVGNKTCHRCYKCAKTAYVCANYKGFYVIRKTGK